MCTMLGPDVTSDEVKVFLTSLVRLKQEEKLARLLDKLREWREVDRRIPDKSAVAVLLRHTNLAGGKWRNLQVGLEITSRIAEELRTAYQDEPLPAELQELINRLELSPSS